MPTALSIEQQANTMGYTPLRQWRFPYYTGTDGVKTQALLSVSNV
jgi:hypothetical protein